MSKEWYNIDVKKEVLESIKKYIYKMHYPISIIDSLKAVSVRDMMDIEYVLKINEIKDPEQFVEFVTEQYMYYRELKYGQEEFWTAASNERDVGYNHKWHEYITDILLDSCERKSNVLFVGTADGAEIPPNDVFNYYALEQVETSVEKIDKKKVKKKYEGDFEDDKLILEKGNNMKAIVALRCLMPNTRLQKFLKFAENNLSEGGILVLSHPLGFLDVNGKYGMLPGCEEKRREFEKRLKDALNEYPLFEIVKEMESIVEYFYVLRMRG